MAVVSAPRAVRVTIRVYTKNDARRLGPIEASCICIEQAKISDEMSFVVILALSARRKVLSLHMADSAEVSASDFPSLRRKN